MIHLRSFTQACVFLAATLCVAGQTAAPTPPPLTKEQKEAAAAVEVPKTFAPPPVPGQLQSTAPAKPAAPTPTPPPPLAPDASASKMQALEAATQPAAMQEAPRVAAPSDKLPITSSTSTSRQFIVHGKVLETRSAMSSRCEEISQELRRVLRDSEPWVLPIVVLLNTGDEAQKSKAPAISTAITEMTHGGFHLQVTVNERPGLKNEDLRKEVVRALLAERVLRNQQKITTPEGRLLLPDWVMTGVLHAMDYKASARPSAIFATIFRSGKIFGIEEIIAASPVEMDGLSRTIYETSCCALVLALVDQPSGSKNFNKFLNALSSDPRSERDLLNAAYPSFAASASSLNKWWALQLAALSKPGIAEPYTPAESLKAIEEAITIHYQAKPDEVPQNIKPRPFVLPPPLITAASLPKPEPLPSIDADTPPKPRAQASSSSPTDDPPVTAENEEESPKRSLWRRMLFLGPADSAAQEKEEPKTKDQPAETAAGEKPDEPQEENKPGFIGRMLSFGGDDKKPDETATAEDKSKPAVTEKPKTAEKTESADQPKSNEPQDENKPGFIGRMFSFGGDDNKPDEGKGKKPAEKPKAAKKDTPEPEEEKKPSNLNPLNWFRGEKKPEENPKKDPPAKDGQSSVLPTSPLDMARLLSPALADAWHMLAPAAPRQTAEPFFNFFRRKPEPEEPKEDEAAKKAEPKKSNKPRAKPKAPATPGSEPEKTKPVTAPHATPAKPGLVTVILPLEEYQHILKREDRAAILNRNIATLRALELRVSILFRPVVTGYLAAVTDLQAGKAKDMDQRLAALRGFALIACQKSIAVRDYLDWFEASQGGGLSGKFDDFLDLPAIIEQELPPRTDPISKYLDAIDQEFTK